MLIAPAITITTCYNDMYDLCINGKVIASCNDSCQSFWLTFKPGELGYLYLPFLEEYLSKTKFGYMLEDWTSLDY
jgi:hypothetical protein